MEISIGVFQESMKIVRYNVKKPCSDKEQGFSNYFTIKF